MNSIYRVELDGEFIGETRLETADPPMGVIGGKVTFSIGEDPYPFFKSYCVAHRVPINQDDEEFGFIDTQNIDGLKVFRSDGVEITGIPGASLCGFRDEGYEITILGVPYPFYGEEFPHHTKAYDDQFTKVEQNLEAKCDYDPLNDYGLGQATTPTSIGAGFLKTIIHMLRRNKDRQNKAEMATPRKPSN